MAIINGTIEADYNLDGTTANDSISGLAGDDNLTGGGGNDTLNGGSGDDILTYDFMGDDFAYAWSKAEVTFGQAIGGTGTDRLEYKADWPISHSPLITGITFNAGAASPAILTKINDGSTLATNVSSIETFLFHTSFGTDSLILGSGNDRVESDWNTIAGAARDTLNGGAGHDELIFRGGMGTTAPLVFNGTAGTASTGAKALALFSNFESFAVGGTRLNDTITGGVGNDLITGMGGTDSLNGGAGLDTLVVGEEQSNVYSSPGDDYAGFIPATAGGLIFNGTTQAGTSGGVSLGTITGFEKFILLGSQRADNLTGAGLADDLRGGVGNDRLSGMAGNDSVHGGAGADTLLGGDGNDALDGGGDVSYWTGVTYVTAVDGNDSIDGGNGNDVLGGANGSDTLLGGAGDDTLLTGGTGNDSVDGGSGTADMLFIGEEQGTDFYFPEVPWTYKMLEPLDPTVTGGKLRAVASEGRATMAGTGAGGVAVTKTLVNFTNIEHFAILGGAFNDVIVGGLLSDTVKGGAGNDIINGGPAADTGDDSLGGDAGNDTLNGLGGNDDLNGGIGNDRILALAGNDYLHGGYDYQDMDGSVIRDGADFLDGGSGDDDLTGGSGNDTLLGGIGNDELDGDFDTYSDGLAGDDSLLGGDGNDELTVGRGVDTARGGLGDDTLSVENADVDRTGGLRAVLSEGVIKMGGTSIATFSEIEHLSSRETTGNDTITGGALDDKIHGGRGTDVLNGAGGFDELVLGEDGYDRAGALVFDGVAQTARVGGASIATLAGFEAFTVHDTTGNDSIIGGNNGDWIHAGSGIDTVAGGGGTDYLYVTPGNARGALNFNALTNVANLGGTRFLDYSGFEQYGVEGTTNADTIQGSSGADYIQGDKGNDILRGGDGDDDINDGDGNDQLSGEGGNDYLSAYVGSDTVYGGAGNDTLYLGWDAQGIDSLTGGPGNDFFELSGASRGSDKQDYSGMHYYPDASPIDPGYAIITDFTAGIDRLALRGAASDFYLGASGIAGVAGTGLFRELGAIDNLFAILRSGDATVLTAANTIAVAEFTVADD